MVELLLAAAALLSCSQSTPPLIAAHRGGLDSAHPENTLAAFRHAAAAGAHVIELDVRATRDGHPVVLHDAWVDRTTNGRGLVHELTLAQVARLDAGNGNRVPTLADVLRQPYAGNVDLLLDIKRAPGLRPRDVLREVRRHRRLPDVLFGVRTLRTLRELRADRQIAGDLRIVGLVARPDAVDVFLDAGVEGIRLWPKWLADDPALIERVHGHGARVWVTTEDAPVGDLEALARSGVDVLLTDRPAAAVPALCTGPT